MIRFLSHIIQRIRLSSEISVEASSIFRILFGLWILFINTPTYRWLAEVPHKLYHHTWLEVFGLSIPDLGYPFYMMLDILVIVSITLVILGIRARLFGSIFLLVNVIGYSIENSLGKINHGGLWFALLLCFILSDWSTRNAILPDRKWRIHKTIISILAICIGFGFLTAGIPKVLHWVDFDMQSSGVIKWWLSGLLTESHAGVFDIHMGRAPSIILEGLDYVASIFEVSSIILLLMGRRYWRFWLIVASIFHLSNCVLFGITFISYIPVYACFLLAPYLDKEINIRWKALTTIVLLAMVFKLVLTFLGVNMLLKESVWNIYLAIIFWIALIVSSIKITIKNRSLS